MMQIRQDTHHALQNAHQTHTEKTMVLKTMLKEYMKIILIIFTFLIFFSVHQKNIYTTYAYAFMSANLNVPAAGHLGEVLVQLKGFVYFVISHAVTAQAALSGIVHLSKYNKFGHVWN